MLLYMTISNLNHWDFTYTDNCDWRHIAEDLIDENLLEEECICIKSVSIIIIRHIPSGSMYAAAYGGQVDNKDGTEGCIEIYKYWKLRGPSSRKGVPMMRDLYTLVPLIIRDIHNVHTVILRVEDGNRVYQLHDIVYKRDSGLAVLINPKYVSYPITGKAYVRARFVDITEYFKMVILDVKQPRLSFHASIALRKGVEKQRFARLYSLDRRMGRRWAQDHG